MKRLVLFLLVVTFVKLNGFNYDVLHLESDPQDPNSATFNLFYEQNVDPTPSPVHLSYGNTYAFTSSNVELTDPPFLISQIEDGGTDDEIYNSSSVVYNPSIPAYYTSTPL